MKVRVPITDDIGVRQAFTLLSREAADAERNGVVFNASTGRLEFRINGIVVATLDDTGTLTPA